MMDETDLRLLGALIQEPFATRAAWGRLVGLSATGVTKRLRRLEADGVIRGWSALPDAAMFGRHAIGVAWDTRADLNRLLAVHDTLWVADSVDGRSGAMGYTTDPEAWLEAVTSTVGAAPFETVRLAAASIPPPGPLEWRVVQAMVDSPRASLRDLCHATGLAHRTVRNRRTALVTTGAVKVEPLLRPSRAGDLAYHLYVQCEHRARGAVRGAAGTHIEIQAFDGGLYLFCHARNLIEQAAILEALRSLPGVTDARVVLNESYVLAADRLRGWIDEARATWRQASGRGPPTSPASASA